MVEVQVRFEWPESDTETLDRQIAERVHKMAVGKASAEDISQATRLIRERGARMMPGAFKKYAPVLKVSK